MSAFTSSFEATSLARLGVRREERRMIKMRADALLVARGLAATRAQAQAAIEAGLARADGMAIRKPSQMLHETVALECAPAHPWVSRGGLKLTHALDAFAIDPSGLICLDVGASTGGFTDVLLARGARRVFAVDVGRGQLAEKLRNDPRVAALEETDARALSRDLVPDAVDLIVSDVSFIGLAKALPAALKLAAPSALLVALIKPQFESGPRKRETIDAEEARAIAEATGASLDGLEGFQRLGLIQSPIEGGAGALEFLYAARRA